ncbi:MAG: ATP-dependent zinc metalloprotease FtsH, partial [Myxococcota bacterium]
MTCRSETWIITGTIGADLNALLYIGILLLVGFVLWRNRVGTAGRPNVMSFGRSRGKWLQDDEVSTTFEDVAGIEESKQELQEIVSYLKTPEKYQRIGARIPKGVLLVGPPGTGKTLLARAVAGEAGVPFISISGSEFVEMFVGVGAARVRDLFEQARRTSPCIVFIDELDALGRSRGNAAGFGSHEEREQTLNQLLVEMDGFTPNDSIILISATNRPEILDAALLRPGRFDRQVTVERPDRDGREAILKVHIRDVKTADDVDLNTIAKRTPGFSGADLANLVNEAALLSARDELEKVSMHSFSEAVDRIIAGLKKKNQHYSDEEKRRVAYHEVGHALAGTLAGSSDVIHKISIVPRTNGIGGFSMQVPERDEILLTRKKIRAKLVGVLGGRAAEEVVFGEPSTGAGNDLQKATEIARAMVVEYGMSDRVGPIGVTPRQQSFLYQGRGMSVRREVGEARADTIDSEVRRI